MKDLMEMTQAEVLTHINTELKGTTISFKSTIYLNWEMNNLPERAMRERAYQAAADRESRHGIACEVVAEWAKRNGKTGKAGRMSRKCRIDRLARCANRQEMEDLLCL